MQHAMKMCLIPKYEILLKYGKLQITLGILQHLV